jgi:redox-sensitive bicupin YhaK (pirin superfamily)
MDGARLRVFIGELGGVRSPVHTFTPLLGAQIDLAAGATVEVPVDDAFEHGVLVDAGEVDAAGTALGVADLWYQSPGHETVALTNRGEGPARVLLLGGIPFAEELVMWWNFVGRSHEEIEQARAQWNGKQDRFGEVSHYPGPERLAAPELPNVRLRPRGRVH